MFTSIHLQNFKSLRDLRIPTVAPVTLIGGTNNVGKTTILEALFLLFDRMNPEMLTRQLVWRSGVTVPPRMDDMWAPYFPALQMMGKIVVEADDDALGVLRMELELDPDFKAPITGASPPSSPGLSKTDTSQSPYSALRVLATAGGAVVQDAHLIITAANIGMHINMARGAPAEAVFMGARVSLAPNDDARRFSKLDVERRIRDVVDLLTPIEPRLKSLSQAFVGDTPQIHADIEGLSRKVPLSYVGHGMARLTSMVLAVMATGRGVVFIDEIENGLHHSLLPTVWRVLSEAAQRAKAQLFVTTHSYECLQAAYEYFSSIKESAFQYTRLDRKGTETKAVSYSLRELGEALESRMEVR